MDAFDVEPGEEVFQCQSYANPFRRDVDILTSESTMTPGSHHLIAFHQNGFTDGPATPCQGLEFHPAIHGAQVPHLLNTYPPGVGRFLPGDDGVKILVHYLNTTTETIHANVKLVLTVTDPANVTAHASGIFMNNLGLSVAPHSNGAATHSCTIPRDIKLLSAGSHMHQHGVHFSATTSNGTILYETSEWSDPEPRRFDPPMAIPAGTEVTWTCDYNNTTGLTLTFGPSAVTNEMCIFNGIYYPAPQGQGIECHR